MDIEVAASRPLTALFSILLETAEGTSLQLTLNLRIKTILPSFLIEPHSLSTRVIRGQSQIFEFSVTDIGKAVAQSVRSILPATDFISFVSFGNPQHTEGNLELENEQSAVLTILVQIPAYLQLGEIVTKIIVASKEVSKGIPVTLTVSLNVLMILSVVVEDEYTYFASQQPLVRDATVTLINYQRDVSITKTTVTGNGTATFIHEGRYEMLVKAANHQSLRQIVVTSAEMPILTVFLRRQAVTYTWSVTPVTFEDSYNLAVEADFKTHVPIPVVTVTPIEIDLEELELGSINTGAYNFASGEVNKIDQCEEAAGVCAIVSIRIEQELAVTREAFLEKLEIENQEDSPLEQIELNIIITHVNTGEEATHLFSIGSEILCGSISTGNDNDKWILPSAMSGAAEWLITPFSEAAPVSNQPYGVSGILTYTLVSKLITVPLFPTKITVTPNV